MIQGLDKVDTPVLKTFPSAQAQDGVAVSGGRQVPRRKRRVGLLGIAFRFLGISMVLLVLIAAGIFYVLSKGPVSNEQLRAQVETQLSTLLGAGHEARVGETKIAFGKNGLLALDATNVRILRDGVTNLGVAREIYVKLKALDLLQGNVEARSLDMRGASVSLTPFLLGYNASQSKPWPNAIDFTALFQVLGQAFQSLEKSITSAGLQKISLSDAKLLGFEALGLRSTAGRLVSLEIEKDKNFQKGTFFSAVLETERSNWMIAGSWKPTIAGQVDGPHNLAISIDGLDISDLISLNEEVPENLIKAHGAIQLNLSAPFNSDGSPQQAVLVAQITNASIQGNNEEHSEIKAAQFNFRFLPEKNQIELERSPVEFGSTSAFFIGGLRFPATVEEADTKPAVFQLAANNLLAYGIVGNEERLTGAANIAGRIDPANKAIIAEDISLLTPNGKMQGQGAIAFEQGLPHIQFDLKIPSMPVSEFKQFWPDRLAGKTREWARNGIREGKIKNAWVKANFPAGLFGNDEAYLPENLSAQVPVFETSVKSVGKLPRITKVNGLINFAGKETEISIENGVLDVGKQKPIAVSGSTLKIGDYTKDVQSADLALSLSGDAASLAKLGTIKPLEFTNDLDLDPDALSGIAKAKVKASFTLQDIETKGLKDWDAKVSLSKVKSRRPVEGRSIDNANLTIVASPKGAKVSGTANVDGVPMKLAMSGPLGKSQGLKRSATLTLSDKDRKKLGADTGKVLTGPISVSLTSTKNGERIEANLRNARLNFPWVGWSKGKGIPGKASFIMKQSKGRTKLTDLKLSGQGFSARGTLSFDKNGLVSAVMKRVRLNKTDDIDVVVKRVKNGYDVKFTARAYDGRSLIQSILKPNTESKGQGTSVTVKGKLNTLIGFNGQVLSNVSVDFAQRGKRVTRAIVNGLAAGKAPTKFALTPVLGGMNTKLNTTNAGSLLRFLNLYTKARGGSLTASLVQDGSGVFRGPVTAVNFALLGEPRLAAMLRRPKIALNVDNRDEIARSLEQAATDRVKVDQLRVDIEKGPGFLNLKRGRLSGGDASAAFDGKVYDRKNRMRITGTYLPARTLNKLVSKIPILGLALGRGKVKGLLGITFKLTGRYGNPKIQVNPLSIIAPGVFREIFKF